MSHLIKLLGWLVLGTLLNILYILILNPEVSAGANVIQLILFIVAWIIVEAIYILNDAKQKGDEQ